jgi:cation transport regulator ChaC
MENCKCGFCKLYEISKQHLKSELEYLNKRKQEVIEDHQKRRMEYIESCIKLQTQQTNNIGIK